MPEFHDLAAQINGTIVIEHDVWLTPRRDICQYILIATHIAKAHLFFIGKIAHAFFILS